MPSTRSPMHRTRVPRRCILDGVLLSLVLWPLAPGVASAHAHLVQANPAPQSVIAHAPAVASFIFDEPVNPTLTQVRIVDASGRQITTGGGHLAANRDGQTWLLQLPPMRAGTYSGFWTAESATDGHVLSSFYT